MNKMIRPAFLLFIFFIPFFTKAQDGSLRAKIREIVQPAKGIVGVSVLGIEDRDTVTYNGKARLVMQSVMKLPIALTVLHLADSGKISLDMLLHIKKKELKKFGNSPLRDKYPDVDVDISFRELIHYMVALSDNNACDILLSVLGGTKPVQDYMLSLGLKGIAVNASEGEMASAWEVQYTNWCKPAEMSLLLDEFYRGKILSKTNTDFLYKELTDAVPGPKRLKGLLPAGTIVAHKTGTSGTDAQRLTPATNDVGIITMPNGKHLIVSVFVCNSTDDETTREAIIAKIAKAVYDFHTM